jgi:hypothetical protein
VTGGFEAFPAANPSTFLSGTASAQLQQSPTFQPLSGAQFAQSFIRPLAPADLLSLAMSGMPVDVLFRLGVQSVNGLSNAVALTRQTGAAGSPEFFQLLQDLRRCAGRLVVIGVDAEPIQVSSLQLIGASRSVLGHAAGTAIDSEDTLAFRLACGVGRSYVIWARKTA